MPDNVKIFATISKGHDDYDKRSSHVLEISENLYRIREGPLIWWKHLKKFLEDSLSFRTSIYDECCFIRPGLILLVYVDDLLVFGDKNKFPELFRKIKKRFRVTEGLVDEPCDFLGMEIKKHEGNIILSQEAYLDKVLENLTFTILPRQTPMPSKRVPNEKLADAVMYQKLLGSVSHLRTSRPDILFALHALSKQGHSPKVEDIETMKHLLGYLQASSGIVRTFYKKQYDLDLPQVVALTDASFATDVPSKCSTSGYYIFFNASLISGTSSKQRRVATV